MSYVFFLFYCCLFSWLLTKSKFVIKSGLSAKTIVVLFVTKVVTGCVHYWLVMWKYGFSDSQGFNLDGLQENNLLYTHPQEYLINIFKSNYGNDYSGIGSSINSYWNDLSSSLVGKFISICDIFSFGNFYINVIFFNYVIFFGAIGLYRVFKEIYKDKPKLLIVCCFLLPSLLFYSSIIHKDGFILAALGIIIFNIYTSLQKRNFLSIRLIYILLMLSFIFVIRSYVFLALLPAVFAWIFSFYKKSFSSLIFIATYILGTIIFFTIGLISPKINLPEIVKNKQASFESLGKSKTFISIDSIQPTFKSFLKISPKALNNSMLRPYITDAKLTLYLLPLGIELLFYQLLILLFIFCRNKNFIQDPFIKFGLFFGISIFLIIGYTVPIIGAIIRYRSIYIPLIITPVICGINWNKIMKLKHMFK